MFRLLKTVLAALLMVPFFTGIGEATTKTFPAGSYIIPMDSTYQPSADGGIFEAYGLVFDLLQNGATVYWIIDETKTSIDAPDITIYNTATTPVVTAYTGRTMPGTVTSSIQYSGAPFVVVPGEGLSQASIEAILSHSDWSAVEIHVSNVTFTANVSRELKGTLPKVALLNNQESTASGTGNAQILESYLSLAGICNDIYDIVTPNNVRDGILGANGYTVLWAPHWTAYSGWTGGNALDADTIVQKIRDFLAAGNSFFAECASIEVMEHSPNGHFLTTTGINHDGGTMDPAKIVYHDTTSPFPQVGDYTYTPEGGHLHNWRPYNTANSSSTMEAYPFVPIPTTNSSYNATVSRFTYDDWDMNPATTNDQWDYYTGGRMDGNDRYGYVVYLGGHKYASCNTGGSSTTSGPVNEKTWQFEFYKTLSSENFTIKVDYTYNGASYTTTAAGITSTGLQAVTIGDPLELDFKDASFNSKKLQTVYVRNKGTMPITINNVTVAWVGGSTGQKTTKLIDKTDTVTLYSTSYSSGHTYPISSYSIQNAPSTSTSGSAIGGCVNNSGCTWTSVAGVRYVLNTLFNLQFTVVDTTYIRSSPVVMDNILYQGTFDYPSYSGHMKAYNVQNTGAGAIWDAMDSVPAAASRNLYTTVDGSSAIPFTKSTLAGNTQFQTLMNMTTSYSSNPSAYDGVIDHIRGADRTNRLGAVEHSAPAIVKPYDRSNPSRSVMAYFGTLDGILEAFNVDSLHGGSGAATEVWGFIPKGQLGSLKDVRNQPNSIAPYPGVDTSPTVAEVYYDHDGNASTNNWRTILSAMSGKYGSSPSVFAIDVTDPSTFTLMWEKTQTEVSTLGAGLRTSMGMVKDASGNPVSIVFATTNRKVNTAATPPEVGGVQVYAFNLSTGSTLWNFSSDYSGSHNDLPGAITLLDKDHDGFVDTVIAGDMEGRLWELDALTGSNVNGSGVPLFNGGAGAAVTNAGIDYPIAASPAVSVNSDNHIIVVFGTGGTDWAPADATHIHSIIALDVTSKKSSPDTVNGAGALLWQVNLAAGEKVWSSPTVANGSVYVTTAFGTMESANPSDDINSTTQQGKLRSLNIDSGALNYSGDIGNTRGSVYIKDGHAYGSTIDGRVVQYGDEDFSSGYAVNVYKLLWKQEK